MNKREFLKTSAILGAGALVAPTIAGSCMNSATAQSATASLVSTGDNGKFLQPELGYEFNALEPHIDAMTMEVHYGKHHAGYTKKFNVALEHEDLHSTNIYRIFENISNYGSGVRNNGGGYFNHNLYWKFMSPNGGGKPAEGGKLAKAIDAAFGSFEKFKELFTATSATHFGSGWGWLLLDKEGRLQVSSTPNQDNPLMDVAEVKGTPLLNVDVWEHAYYLNYQNMRKSYLEAYWNVVDWKFIEALYEEAIA